jgi:hypothetical protein
MRAYPVPAQKRKNFILTYIVLFLFVCAFWLIQKLNQNQEADWEVSINLAVYQENQLVERSEVPLTLSLQGSGWNLLKANRKGLPKELLYTVPLSDLELISDSSIKEFLSEEVRPFGLMVMKTIPSTIELRLQNLEKKEIRLIQPLSIGYRKGYGSLLTATDRDTLITLMGRKEDLPLKDTLVLDTLYFKDLKEDLQFHQPLEDLFEKTQWKSSQNWVLQLKVEKFTDKTLVIEPKIKGIPKEKRARTIPKTISLQCSVPISLYEQITSDVFETWIDLDSTLLYGKERIGLIKIHSDHYPMLKPKLYPSQVKILVYEKQ